jgi:hypothetical protein
LPGDPSAGCPPGSPAPSAVGGALGSNSASRQRTPELPQLWGEWRARLERRTHSPGRRAGKAGCAPYRRAGGNGFGDATTERFWTDRLYERVRQGTRRSGWINEASPWLYPGECQYLALNLPLSAKPESISVRVSSLRSPAAHLAVSIDGARRRQK